MSFIAWFRARVDDPRSGQRQKEYGTWEASERKFRKIPAKKGEKGTERRKSTEKKEKKEQRTKLQHAGWKEEKREKTRTDQQRRTKKNRK